MSHVMMWFIGGSIASGKVNWSPFSDWRQPVTDSELFQWTFSQTGLLFHEHESHRRATSFSHWIQLCQEQLWLSYTDSQQVLLLALQAYIGNRTWLVLLPQLLQFGVHHENLLLTLHWISQITLHWLEFLKMVIISSLSFFLVIITLPPAPDIRSSLF